MKFWLQKLALVLSITLSVSLLSAQTNPPWPVSFTVAQDGSGNYKTIQEAITAVRALAPREVKIFIKKGVYHEKIVVPSWETKISLIGESRDSTIITNDDHTGKPTPYKDAYGLTKYITFTTYTLLVEGDDFTAENLTIQNTAGRVGQAVALHIEGDRATIKNCKLLGNQDTLYTAKENSRQYYLNCYIEGTTDFIFGEATCVFQNCTIKSLTNSFITAAATRPGQKFGYVFFDCKLVSDSADKVYLGRPWRAYSKTVYINTEMGNHIIPVGWDNWGDANNEKTTYYAEYNSKGPGANTAGRVKWAKQLTNKEAKLYTLENIFKGNNPWKPAM